MEKIFLILVANNKDKENHKLPSKSLNEKRSDIFEI